MSDDKKVDVRDSAKADVGSLQKAGREAATKARGGRRSKIMKMAVPTGIAVFILSLPTWLPEWWASKRFFATTPPSEVVAINPPIARGGLRRESMLVATDLPSPPMLIPSDECLRWHGVDPDGQAFIAEVRGVNDATWHRWENFLKLRNEKKLSYTYPGWIRFTATGELAEVFYKFYDLASVKCN